LYYGGDYNPEQWPESVWREDVTLMREAGVNLVTVGVFAWSSLEPAPGEYRFDWLDHVLDLLWDNGIRVALATPTASPPPWFSLAHPEALPVTRDGVRRTHGSRDTYCASAPAYRQAALRIAEALATHYGTHPALAMWHVHNEYGTGCHCDLAAESFRHWLRRRYGDLARLNEAWTTAFWSQGYRRWAEVLPPRATQYLPNPAQVLDFRRFLSDELLSCFIEQRDAVRRYSPGVPVTTNFALGDWVPVDNWAWAAEVDLVAIDCYPSQTGVDGHRQTAFAADLARSWAGGGTWLLMEQSANLVLTDRRMLSKDAGELTRLSLSHLARGSRGALFFQWRASSGGAEMFGSSMVPHAGPDSRAFRAIVELGGVLSRLSDVDTGRLRAEVAVLWDPPSWWALQGPGLPSDDHDYLAVVRGVHSALLGFGVSCDFARAGADLSGYRLVCVPSLFVLSRESAEVLRRYVAGGGTLVVTYLTGVVDGEHRAWLGGYLAGLWDVLGVRVEEFRPLPAGTTVSLSTGDIGREWSERLRTEGATVTVRYPDGLPAVTRNRYGNGTAWYLSTDIPGILDRIAAATGLVPGPGRDGLEVLRRVGDGTSWLFAINHTDEVHEVPAHGVDLLTGVRVEKRLRLAPGGYSVVREEPNP
jgi:beta-galactosidase